MSDARRIVSAAEMDKMSPQDRAVAVNAGVVRDWDDVDPAFRLVVEEKAQRLAATLRSDA